MLHSPGWFFSPVAVFHAEMKVVRLNRSFLFHWREKSWLQKEREKKRPFYTEFPLLPFMGIFLLIYMRERTKENVKAAWISITSIDTFLSHTHSHIYTHIHETFLMGGFLRLNTMHWEEAFPFHSRVKKLLSTVWRLPVLHGALKMLEWGVGQTKCSEQCSCPCFPTIYSSCNDEIVDIFTLNFSGPSQTICPRESTKTPFYNWFIDKLPERLPTSGFEYWKRVPLWLCMKVLIAERCLFMHVFSQSISSSGEKWDFQQTLHIKNPF